MKVWLPEMLEDREDSFVRMAPMSHAGELQGVIVVERPVSGGEAFSADEERTVVELGRMLGVALRNAQLDSALQASLDEVRRQAEEWQAARGRIVAAAAEAEATVYFCVLEALQNAGKYAGEAASITVDVREEDSSLVFVVADDGLGFDVHGKGVGAGFQNMLDRLGSLGGILRVESKPNRRTRVTGVLPVNALAA